MKAVARSALRRGRRFGIAQGRLHVHLRRPFDFAQGKLCASQSLRSTRWRDLSKLGAMKIKSSAISIALAFGFVALLRSAEAVVPPPDGGYPGFTTAEGTNALKNLTSGVANTATGWYSLFSDTTGSFNTSIGGGALALNTADSNTAVGAAALLLNTTGTQNTAIGTASLVHNDTAEQNTATGAFALSNHVSGNGNTANGANALFSDTSGQLNTAIGAGALFTDDNGFNGSFNTAVGASALLSNTGGDNTAVGAQALQSNTTGNDNTAIGISALVTSQTGNRNIALGNFAGSGLTSGSDNIYIGANLSAAAGESDTCHIKSIFGQTAPGGSAVFIDASHKLGTLTSSKRFKQGIKPVGTASQALFALTPVTFHYKKEIDPAGISQFGLVAEDVEKVNPDLVVRDKDGKPYSVRYDQVNAMLLNEFLKEHKKVEVQQATIVELKSEMKTLAATVHEQALELRDVKTQIQINNSANRVIAHNQ
jgi:hypothetical protein